MNDLLNEICTNYGLGNMINTPIKITGGITNTIYKIETTSGLYVIKVINKSNIDRNPNLLLNIENSEEIALVAKENGINSIVAIKLNNNYINKLSDIHFIVYEWCDGNVLLSKELNVEHMKVAARALANLHKIKIENNIVQDKFKKIDFIYYYELLKDNNEDCYNYFKQNINKLIVIYNEVFDNYNKLTDQLSYIHGDYNRKNLLWKNYQLHIIDWETASISNPSIDFFNSAWFLTDDIDKDKYIAFTKEYLSIMKIDDNFEIAIRSSIINECNWLEYSLKRSLGILNNSPEDITIGKKSIEPSLNEILNYYSKIPLMIKYLKEIIE